MFRAFATDATLPQLDPGSGKQPNDGVHLTLWRVEGLTRRVLPCTGGYDHGYRESSEVSTACEKFVTAAIQVGATHLRAKVLAARERHGGGSGVVRGGG